MATWRRDHPKTTKGAIQSLERELKVQLPEAYRAFLLKQNGGSPDLRFFARTRSRGVHYVESLYGIHDGLENLKSECLLAWESGIVPQGFLSIGSDGSGNCFAIDFHSENFGRVMFCDHEFEWPSDVCDSFDQLLAGLSDEETAERTAGSVRLKECKPLTYRPLTQKQDLALLKKALGGLARRFQFHPSGYAALIKPPRGISELGLRAKPAWLPPRRGVQISLIASNQRIPQIEALRRFHVEGESSSSKHLTYVHPCCPHTQSKPQPDAAAQLQSLLQELLGEDQPSPSRRKKK